MARRRDPVTGEETANRGLEGPDADSALKGLVSALPENPPSSPQGRSGESPRERAFLGSFEKLPQLRAPGPSGSRFSPSPPMAPQPLAGQVSTGTSGTPPPTATPGPVGVQPLRPLAGGGMGDEAGQPDIGNAPTAVLRQLFGGAGGLQGGGLGVPGASSAAASDPMSGLIEALLASMGRGPS